MREFQLPDVGEGVAEGEIVRWLVGPGDPVEEDQPVAEVETDKALVEVPAPVDGTVRELRAEEGEVVPVGTVIIVFDEAGDERDGAEEAGTESDEAGRGGAADDGGDPVDADGDGRSAGRTVAPPSVRRLARELGVDLAAVDGSGPGGRVTEGDVRAAADGEEPPEGEGDGAEPAVAAPAGADRERTLAAPATRRVARELGVDIDAVPATEERDGGAFVTEEAVREYAEAQQAAQEADAEAVSTGGDTGAGDTGEEAAGERVPYRGVRRTIGERMAESKYTAPHVTHHDTAVVEALVEARERLRPRAEARDTRLTYMPFVVKAVVAALEEHPYMNATLDGEAGEIVLHDRYDVGIAVATDHGLMVPVVEDADALGLFELADEIGELAGKARERTIAPEELRGSTFSITNFGAIGGEYATPIINYPEAAILGLGAIEQRPVVEGGEVVARHTLPLSLSIDHRIVDGAVAAEFANAVMEYLNEPLLLLE